MTETSPRRAPAPAAMRSRLIEATVACLVEFGYAGTTTQRVQDRAGVSRGALLYHFSSKSDLFVAAIDAVSDQQTSRIREIAAARTNKVDRVSFGIAVLREGMSGPLFLAGHELWMASRTDTTLRNTLAPSQRAVGKALRDIGAELFGTTYTELPGYRVAFDSLLQLLRGLAMTSVLRDDPAIEERVLAMWSGHFTAMCTDSTPNPT